MDIDLVSNSPGEISAWVTPLVHRFKSINPKLTLRLFLLPCQYRSGYETEAAKQLSGLSTIFSPRDTQKFLLSRPFRYPAKQGAIIGLGGDPFYVRILGWKLRKKTYYYAATRRHPKLGFTQTFLKSQIGDLAADWVEQAPRTTDFSSPYCLFLCGSRPQHFFNWVGLMQKTVRFIQDKHPQFKAVLMISPFINPNQLNRFLDQNPLPEFKIVPYNPGWIKHATFMVTIPGTNTAQAAYLHTPMLVILPTDQPQHLIFDGLVGQLGQLPLVGRPIKSYALRQVLKKTPWIAQPNQWAGSKVVPELIGPFSAKTIGEKIIAYWTHPNARKAIQDGLQHLPIKRGAADYIVKSVIANT